MQCPGIIGSRSRSAQPQLCSWGSTILKLHVPQLIVVVTAQLLLMLWLVIEDHDNLFIMAESVHFLGIGVLIYKLITKKNAGGALRSPQSGRSAAACAPPTYACLSVEQREALSRRAARLMS